jgi:hypothetical protein
MDEKDSAFLAAETGLSTNYLFSTERRCSMDQVMILALLHAAEMTRRNPNRKRRGLEDESLQVESGILMRLWTALAPRRSERAEAQDNIPIEVDGCAHRQIRRDAVAC